MASTKFYPSLSLVSQDLKSDNFYFIVLTYRIMSHSAIFFFYTFFFVLFSPLQKRGFSNPPFWGGFGWGIFVHIVVKYFYFHFTLKIIP